MTSLDPTRLLRFGNISIKKEDEYIKIVSEQTGGACGIFCKFDVQPNTVYEITVEASVISKGSAGIWVSDNGDRTLIWKHNVFGLSMRSVRHLFQHRNVKQTNIGVLIKNPSQNDIVYLRQISFLPKSGPGNYNTLQKPLSPEVLSSNMMLQRELEPTIQKMSLPVRTVPTNDPVAEMEKMSLEEYDYTKTLPLKLAPGNNDVLKTLTYAKQVAEEKARLAEEACRIAEQKSLEAHNARQLAEQRAKQNEAEKHSVQDGYLTLKKKVDQDTLAFHQIVQQKTVEAEQAIQQAELKVREAEEAKKNNEETIRKKEQETLELREKTQTMLRLLEEERKQKQQHEANKKQIQDEKRRKEEELDRLERERLQVEQRVKQYEEENQVVKNNYITLKKQHDDGILEIARINKMVQEREKETQRIVKEAEERARQKEEELATLREKINPDLDGERKRKEEELIRLEQRKLQMEKELQEMEAEKVRRMEELNTVLPKQVSEEKGVLQEPPPDDTIVIDAEVPDPNQLKTTKTYSQETLVRIRTIPLSEKHQRRILCCISGNLNESGSHLVLLDRWIRMISTIPGTEIHVLSEYEIQVDQTPLSDDVITNTNVKFFQPSQFKEPTLLDEHTWLKTVSDLGKGYQYDRVFLTASYLVVCPEVATLFDKKMDVYFDGSFFDISNSHTIEQVANLVPSISSIWVSSTAVLQKAKEDFALDTSHQTVVFLPVIKQTISVKNMPKINKSNKIKMLFVGSLSKLYMLDECLSAYENVAPVVNNVEFHIFGTIREYDKWTTQLVQKIKTTENVVYHENEPVKNIHEYHLGLVFRNRLMDQDLEMPEMIIKLSSYGVPCFVNGFSTVLRSFFGHDYNGYMTGPEDLPKKIFFYSRNRKVYEADQMRCIRSAQMYTEKTQLSNIQPLYVCGQ